MIFRMRTQIPAPEISFHLTDDDATVTIAIQLFLEFYCLLFAVV